MIKRTAAAAAVFSVALTGCPGGWGTPSPTPPPAETETPAGTASPTATATSPGGTGTPAPTVAPTATATPTHASTPTGTPSPTVTPTPPACIAPADGSAVCLDVGAEVFRVDGIVVQPVDAPAGGLPYFGKLVARFNGFADLTFNNATTTDDAGNVSATDIASLNITPESSNTTTSTDAASGALTVTAIDPDLPFGIDIDLGNTSAFGSGWQLGTPAGDDPGFAQSYGFYSGPTTLVATEKVATESSGVFYSAAWQSEYGTVCVVRLYLLGEVVATLTESCQDVRYQILDGPAPRALPQGNGDDPPPGMQEFDVAESRGKIRYTFTGTSTYDFDLP